MATAAAAATAVTAAAADHHRTAVRRPFPRHQRELDAREEAEESARGRATFSFDCCWLRLRLMAAAG